MGTELGIVHPVSGTSEKRDQMDMNLRTVVTKKGVMVMMSCTWKSSSSPTAHKECQKENAKRRILKVDPQLCTSKKKGKEEVGTPFTYLFFHLVVLRVVDTSPLLDNNIEFLPESF